MKEKNDLNSKLYNSMYSTCADMDEIANQIDNAKKFFDLSLKNSLYFCLSGKDIKPKAIKYTEELFTEYEERVDDLDRISEILHKKHENIETLLKELNPKQLLPVAIKKGKVTMDLSRMDKNIAYPIDHKGKTFFIQKPEEGRLKIYEVI